MGRKGFSTIEMIIVVVLIGIIASIGWPRMRRGYEKQQVRSAKALIATLTATARGAAIQRGCNATLNLSSDSIWVTACGVNPPAVSVRVGTKKVVGSEFGVVLSSTQPTIVFDPRGLATVYQPTTIRVVGPRYRDSVTVNEVGKVTRQ
jgi:prepilin-type N-terminal cleavage/methylation domain-containing protein